jgi:mitogen-activated protein kinase 1/3
MRKKDPVPFSQKFPSADPLALKLLEKLLAFDPKDRLTAEEVVLCCCLILKLIRV